MNVTLFVIAGSIGAVTFLFGGLIDRKFPAGRTAYDPAYADIRRRIRRRVVVGGLIVSILLALAIALAV